MIKKIILALLLCGMIISCGKKGDPEYKQSKKITISESILINRA